MFAFHVAAQQVDNPGQTPMKDTAAVVQSGPTAQDHVENPSNTPLKDTPLIPASPASSRLTIQLPRPLEKR